MPGRINTEYIQQLPDSIATALQRRTAIQQIRELLKSPKGRFLEIAFRSAAEAHPIVLFLRAAHRRGRLRVSRIRRRNKYIILETTSHSAPHSSVTKRLEDHERLGVANDDAPSRTRRQNQAPREVKPRRSKRPHMHRIREAIRNPQGRCLEVRLPTVRAAENAAGGLRASRKRGLIEFSRIIRRDERLFVVVATDADVRGRAAVQ